MQFFIAYYIFDDVIAVVELRSLIRVLLPV